MPPSGGFLEEDVHPEDSSRSLFEAFGFLPADETELNRSMTFPRMENTSNQSTTFDEYELLMSQLNDDDFDPSLLWSQLTEDDFVREDLSESMRSLFAVLYVAIIFLGLIGNLAVIFIICTGPKLRTVTNMFLVSLAASDLLIAGVNMPFQLRFHLQSEWTGGEVLCKLSYYLQGAVIVASILTLTGIALDRYYAIMHPLRARHVHTVKRALILISIFWLFALLLMSPQIFLTRLEPIFAKPTHELDFRLVHICTEYFPDHRLRILYTLLFYFVIYLLPVSIIFVTYGRIMHRLWTRPSIGETSASESSRDFVKRRLDEKRRIVRMLVVVVVLFSVGWFPFFTFHVAQLFRANSKSHAHRVALASLQLFGYSNCCVNPIIYCFLNDSFQQRFYQLFFGCFSRWRQSSNASSVNAEAERINGIGMTSLTRHSIVDQYPSTEL